MSQKNKAKKTMENNQALRIIKKYPNRRLYDTHTKSYITLIDIQHYVYDHIVFQVIDTRTKKDLTQSTLLQIIAEQEISTTPLFTTDILQNFIRSYQEKSQHVFTSYLEQAMNLFLTQKSLFHNQWALYQQLLTDPASVQKILNESIFINKQHLKKKKSNS